MKLHKLSILNQFSLVARLVLLISTCGIGAVSIITYLTTDYFANQKIEESQRESLKMANTVALAIEQWNDKLAKLTLSLANNSIITDSDLNKVEDFLKKLDAMYEETYIIFITDQNGVMTVRSDGGKLLNNSDRSYIQSALSGKQLSHQTIISKTLNKPAVCYSSPILNKQKKITGVVASCSLLDKLSEQIMSFKPGINGKILVTDEQNFVIADTQHNITTLTTFIENLNVQEGFLNKKNVEYSFCEKDKCWIAAAAINQDKWKFYIYSDKDEVLKHIDNIKNISFLISVFFSFMFFLITILVVQISLSPIKIINKSLVKMKEGIFSERISISGSYEIEQLAQSFNLMAEKIEELFEENLSVRSRLLETNQRLENDVIEKTQMLVEASKMSALGEMVGGIAHEINTPLATVKLLNAQALSELQEPIPDMEKAVEFCSKVDATIDRISKIIKGLKTFSRSGDYDPMQSSSLQVALEDTLILVGDSINSEKIELRWNVPPETIKIECREVELVQVFLNLINNSIDAVRNLSNKWIDVQLKEDIDFVELKFSDSGSGINKDIVNKIFQPFVTTKAPGKGTGIGLSISHGIIANHGGKIFVDTTSANTCFVIILPKTQNHRIT